MKKRNKVIVGVLVLFLVMAVGYALFTATLKINGTASASGNFDLTYECEAGFENGGTGTCEVDGNTITTTSTLVKPNDAGGFSVKVTNTGTIPAVLTTVNSPNNVDIGDLNVAGDKFYFDRTTYLGAYYMVNDEINSDGVCIGNDFIGKTEVENANITIQPGKSIAIFIINGWVDSAELNVPQPEIPEGGASIRYDLTFEFQQTVE